MTLDGALRFPNCDLVAAYLDDVVWGVKFNPSVKNLLSLRMGHQYWLEAT